MSENGGEMGLTKIRRASRGYYFALHAISGEAFGSRGEAYFCPSLENDWLVTGTFAEGKRADGLGRFVVVCSN